MLHKERETQGHRFGEEPGWGKVGGMTSRATGLLTLRRLAAVWFLKLRFALQQ